jgi:hypothetical protein
MKMMPTPTAVAAVIAAAALTTAADAASFDGGWSVSIQTTRGSCDPTYNVGINISNGVISGPAGVQGRVSSSGAVSVSVSSGGSSASGSGRLHGNAGGGSWSGHGSRGPCSGRWSASRG